MPWGTTGLTTTARGLGQALPGTTAREAQWPKDAVEAKSPATLPWAMSMSWKWPFAGITLWCLATEVFAPATAATDYWAVEDAAARERLPRYEVIPAARPEELTPANGYPRRETYLRWQRSHGDNGGTRYSALTQINRHTVTNLAVAWTYHARDASNNIQCNPIIVDGVMFAPTPGKHVVAVDAATGVERWRFKPEGRPAFRGLTYWPGRSG
ncbi:partial Alcohol dehydrogenase (quinone), dehydrogenase subunit, partial [Gammaproteobacteria bacterium]